MLVTGGPPNFGGAAYPSASNRQLAVGADVAHYRRRIVGEHAWHRRQVADVSLITRNSAMMAAWLVVML